jgi:hypothetical protein
MAAVPVQGDKPFVEVKSNVWHGISLHALVGLDDAYANGFHDAAAWIINAIQQSTAGDDHNYNRMIPACFLYRQFLELQLKNILYVSRKLKYVEFDDEDLISHSLLELWNTTEQIIDAVLPGKSLIPTKTIIKQSMTLIRLAKSFDIRKLQAKNRSGV